MTCDLYLSPAETTQINSTDHESQLAGGHPVGYLQAQPLNQS